MSFSLIDLDTSTGTPHPLPAARPQRPRAARTAGRDSQGLATVRRRQTRLCPRRRGAAARRVLLCVEHALLAATDDLRRRVRAETRPPVSRQRAAHGHRDRSRRARRNPQNEAPKEKLKTRVSSRPSLLIGCPASLPQIEQRGSVSYAARAWTDIWRDVKPPNIAYRNLTRPAVHACVAGVPAAPRRSTCTAKPGGQVCATTVTPRTDGLGHSSAEH